jgi:hypothetical protein
MTFDVANWSPNYLAEIPYNLQLKQVLLNHIRRGTITPEALVLRELRKRGIPKEKISLIDRCCHELVREGVLEPVSRKGYRVAG